MLGLQQKRSQLLSGVHRPLHKPLFGAVTALNTSAANIGQYSPQQHIQQLTDRYIAADPISVSRRHTDQPQACQAEADVFAGSSWSWASADEGKKRAYEVTHHPFLATVGDLQQLSGCIQARQVSQDPGPPAASCYWIAACCWIVNSTKW